ncbi:CPBP family intramembrane metalloprotease [candidate division KSB1 bacterium]|nr:CPBP family intramembrane metalloprotease [candidate division KSB1 bacterium]
MQLNISIKKPFWQIVDVSSLVETNKKFISALEISIIFGFAMLLVWIISPLNNTLLTTAAALLALAFTFISHYYHWESLSSLGLRWDYFRPAFKNCGILTLGIFSILLSTELCLGTLQLGWILFPKVLVYFFWALFQQFFFTVYFVTRLRDIFPSRAKIALICALLFSLIHLPNPALMIATLVCGFLWALIYYSYPNLYLIALSHAILAVLFKYSLPNILIHGMKVGPGCF